MAERIVRKYKPLFELKLLHHYWLDEGDKVFDSLPDKDKKTRLRHYDVQSILSITPTATTEKLLMSFGGIYKNTALGCIVAILDTEVLPLDTLFEFIIRVKDAAFFNYTALTLRSQEIYEFVLPSEGINSEDHPLIRKIYRYKENVPVLSNLTGATRGADEIKTLFLSKEFPNQQNTDLVESLVLSSDNTNTVLQLTGDQPDADTKQLGKLPDLPVFVHQADVPAIVPPRGLDGVPARGLLLSNDIPDNVFVLVQLSPVRKDDDDFSFINKNTGHAKINHPVFQIRFKNRATFWRYLNKNNGALVSEETEPLPLTYFGNAGKKQKPFSNLVEPKKSGNKITQLVSNIFV